MFVENFSWGLVRYLSNGMITDIHAHVLPGIDDGPASIDESKNLLDKFHACNTDRVFCTSHYLSPHFEVSLEALDDAFKALSVHSQGNGPVLAKGAEVRITSGLIHVIQEDNIPTLGNTRFVLVEFRSDVIAERSLELIHELMVRDYQPIMAHPERNLSIQKDPKLLDDLQQAGLLFQLTAWCFDKPARLMHVPDKLAWKILEDGYAAVIASDAHNTETRPPGLLQAYDNIALRLGQSAVDTLISNANAIWDDMPCSAVEVVKPKKSLLRTIFR
jgi:protein-tyrosine phosphatase